VVLHACLGYNRRVVGGSRTRYGSSYFPRWRSPASPVRPRDPDPCARRRRSSSTRSRRCGRNAQFGLRTRRSSGSPAASTRPWRWVSMTRGDLGASGRPWPGCRSRRERAASCRISRRVRSHRTPVPVVRQHTRPLARSPGSSSSASGGRARGRASGDRVGPRASSGGAGRREQDVSPRALPSCRMPQRRRPVRRYPDGSRTGDVLDTGSTMGLRPAGDAGVLHGVRFSSASVIAKHRELARTDSMRPGLSATTFTCSRGSASPYTHPTRRRRGLDNDGNLCFDWTGSTLSPEPCWTGPSSMKRRLRPPSPSAATPGPLHRPGERVVSRHRSAPAREGMARPGFADVADEPMRSEYPQVRAAAAVIKTAAPDIRTL